MNLNKSKRCKIMINSNSVDNSKIKIIFEMILEYLRGKAVLVVGTSDYFNLFKSNYGDRFDFVFIESLGEISKFNYDIIIDNKNKSKEFNIIYGEKTKICSFIDLYSEFIFQKTFNSLKEKKVNFLYFYAPVYTGKLKRQVKNWEETRKDSKLLQKLYEDNIDCLNYAKSKEASWAFSNVNNGVYNILPDMHGKYINIIGGKRLTTDTPKFSANNIYFYGPCTVRGGFVSDKYTIPSFVQRFVNLDFKETYEVINCGTNGGRQHIDYFEYIFCTELKKGDTVILIDFYNNILEKSMKKNSIESYDLSPLFNNQKSEMWFIDNAWHPTHKGNEVISRFIYQKLKPLLKYSKINDTYYVKDKSENKNFWLNNNSFVEYIDKIKSEVKNISHSNTIGSVVMNCNPFTLGHRYIIDEALNKVDYLYVFVVEEDLSYFSFKDRFKMVKLGTKDIKNIKIFPSGKWIISQLTFPEYFSKETKNNITVTPYLDTNLFKVIASELNISARFVGEEPKDNITRQYNKAMRKEFYKSNVKLYEIPRKRINGNFISASTVRRFFCSHNYKEMKKYVPESTYNYLISL